MKNLVILAAIASGAVVMTSCGQGKATLATMEDSLSYAVGIDIAGMSRSFDSTMNPDIISQAIKDAYAKNPQMSPEQAQAFIGEYMSVGRVRKTEKASAEFLEKASKESGVVKSESGLLYKIENAGSDVKAALGDTVLVNYVLYMPNGTILEESKGTPVSFPLAEGRLIPAWLEGVPLIGEGGKVTLYVPSDLAYGDNGTGGGPIGPKQALKFDVELVKVTKPTPAK